MYLDDTSDLEKQVLSGAIIAESITKDGDNSLTIATALTSAIFGIDVNQL